MNQVDLVLRLNSLAVLDTVDAFQHTVDQDLFFNPQQIIFAAHFGLVDLASIDLFLRINKRTDT